MRAMSEAIEGARAFSDLVEKITRPSPSSRHAEIMAEQRQQVTGENRRQRRARERTEAKAAKRAKASA